MTFPALQPLFAADPGTVIGLIVGALTLLGWILNYANQKQAQPPAGRPNQPGRPRRPAEDRLQSEIDVFLEEVRGGRRKLAEEPARPAAATPRRPAPKPAEPPPRRRLQSTEPRPLEPNVVASVEPRISQRKRVAAAEDATRIRPRGTEHGSSERLVAHASQLGRGVETAVQQHLGLFTGSGAATPADPPPPSSLADQVRSLLREPAGVRQAILISEILSRPGARRRS